MSVRAADCRCCRGWDTLGVEPSTEMRAVARRRIAALPAGAGAVKVVEGAAERTGLPDGCADIVTASQAMHWFDADRALPEIARVLRPGGVLASYDCDWPPCVDAEMVTVALSQGGTVALRARGIGDDELGLTALRKVASRRLATQKPWWWTYRSGWESAADRASSRSLPAASLRPAFPAGWRSAPPRQPAAPSRWRRERRTLVDMPRYEYRCRACGAGFEVTRPMSESSAPCACPDGHDDTVRLLSTVAVGGVAGRSGPVAGSLGGGCACGGSCGCGN